MITGYKAMRTDGLFSLKSIGSVKVLNINWVDVIP